MTQSIVGWSKMVPVTGKTQAEILRLADAGATVAASAVAEAASAIAGGAGDA
jgi:hypothetical protein